MPPADAEAKQALLTPCCAWPAACGRGRADDGTCARGKKTVWQRQGHNTWRLRMDRSALIVSTMTSILAPLTKAPPSSPALSRVSTKSTDFRLMGHLLFLKKAEGAYALQCTVAEAYGRSCAPNSCQVAAPGIDRGGVECVSCGISSVSSIAQSISSDPKTHAAKRQVVYRSRRPCRVLLVPTCCRGLPRVSWLSTHRCCDPSRTGVPLPFRPCVLPSPAASKLFFVPLLLLLLFLPWTSVHACKWLQSP